MVLNGKWGNLGLPAAIVNVKVLMKNTFLRCFCAGMFMVRRLRCVFLRVGWVLLGVGGCCWVLIRADLC